MTVVALTTPSTARSAGDQVDAALAAMRRHLPVELVVTDDDDRLRQVLTAGHDRVVVMGGDGSLHHAVTTLDAVGGLADGPAFGLVPLGTGNDLARGLGVPLDPAAAGDLAAGGDVTALALLREEGGQVVVNAVHCGAGAEAAARAGRSKSVLGRLAYDVNAVLTGLRTSGWHLRVEVDGEVLHDGDERVLLAVVGLGGTIGGGAPVALGADPVRGVAEVSVSLATGPLSRFGYALAMRRGDTHRRPDVRRARGTDVRVSVTAGAPFRTDADGEVAGPFTTQRWRVEPRAWRLVVPPA